MPRRQQKRQRMNRNSTKYGTITVHRMLIGDIGQGSGSVDRGIYRSYSLSEFPYSDIAGAFQEYRIKKFITTYQLYTQPNNNSKFPTLYLAPQIFTNTALAAPSTRDEVVQFVGVKTHQFGPSNLTKVITTPAYTFVGAERRIVKSPWLNITADGVRHTTLVEWLSNYNTGTDNSHVIRLSVKAIIELRKTR